jgi:hypothetical protein
MATMADKPKSTKKAQTRPRRAPAKATARKRTTKKANKIKTEEQFILEQLEGEEFDTTDFKLVTDWSDAE